MAFKQDEDFLRFITMGAAGGQAVARFLTHSHGHRMVELERYAMANKIWANKLKRLRLADLVCLDCGLRVEARAKSKLEIRMSHSDTATREWDAGLRDSDLCAFVRWHADEGRAADRPELFAVGDMRKVFEFAKLGPRKSASEGAERDVTWPTSVPKEDGTVESVDYDEGKVVVRLDRGGRRSYWLRNDVPTYIYVDEGDTIHGGEEFVVGCVAGPPTLQCPKSGWAYQADLDAEDPITRYVGVKVAGEHADPQDEPKLLRIATDEDEDPRIRLEARASLACIDPSRYTREVVAVARGGTVAADREAKAFAMEAIFILSELGTAEAADALVLLAGNRDLDPEARSAAVWGLGVTGFNKPALVLPYIADDDEGVALHALAAIGEAPELIDALVDMLGGSETEAASAAAQLAQQGEEGLKALITVAIDDRPGADWAIGTLGQADENTVRRIAGGNLADDLAERLEPMWKLGRSWLARQQMDTPLHFLKRQTIRYLAA